MSEEARQSVGVLSQRLYAAEETNRSIVNQLNQLASRVEALFSSLNTKIEDARRPQYAIMIGLASLAVSFLAGLGFLSLDPIKSNQTRLEGVVVELSKTMAAMNVRYYETLVDQNVKANQRFTSKDEFTIGAKLRDTLQENTNEKIERLNEDIKAIEKTLVPRGEHEEKWRGNEARAGEVQRQFAAMREEIQRQLDAIKKDFGDLYSPRDAFKNMQQRIDDLERLVRNRAQS